MTLHGDCFAVLQLLGHLSHKEESVRRDMSRDLLLPSQHTYIPAIGITRATHKHSWGRMGVATVATPDQLCGEARRIGYTGKDDDALALYRLKIKLGGGLPTVTLPSLYIVEDGCFVDYEQWCQAQSSEPQSASV
jgi:hypothetical protein